MAAAAVSQPSDFYEGFLAVHPEQYQPYDGKASRSVNKTIPVSAIFVQAIYEDIAERSKIKLAASHIYRNSVGPDYHKEKRPFLETPYIYNEVEECQQQIAYPRGEKHE